MPHNFVGHFYIFYLYQMSQELIVSTASKEKQYISVIQQIKALTDTKDNYISSLANISAALKQQFGWFWVGFYLVIDNQLILGPFQGTIACTTIQKNKGVCGTAWERKKTVIVEDVEKFPGHIACSNTSRSEIVVPIFNKQNDVVAVLDVDSEYLSFFDETDQKYLEELCVWIGALNIIH